MPVANLADRKALIDLGIDPDQYNDPVVPTPVNPPSKSSSSSLGAGIRGVMEGGIKAAIPNAAGLVTAGLGSAAFSPLVGIPAGLFVGAMATKAQEDITDKHNPLDLLPDNIKETINQQRQADIEQHPTSTQVGQAVGGVASGLPFLRPQIPKTIPDLKNLGLNSALQGTINYVQQAIHQGTINPKMDVTDAISVLGGAAMSKATPLGGKIGLAVNEPVTRTINTEGGETTISGSDKAKLDEMARRMSKPQDQTINVEATPVKETPTVTESQPTSKVAPVEYIGTQTGVEGKIPDMKLYNLTEDHPTLGPKGSTITDQSITKAGLELPNTKSELDNLEKSGLTKEDIYNKTGYWKLPGGAWSKEHSYVKVPDDFTERYFDIVKNKGPQSVKGFTLPEIIGEDHPVLKEHPYLANMKIYVDMQAHKGGGGFLSKVGHDDSGAIQVKMPIKVGFENGKPTYSEQTINVDNTKKVGQGKYTQVNKNPSEFLGRILNHEINHAISQHEGLPEGGSTLDYFFDKNKKFSDTEHSAAFDYYKKLEGEALSRVVEKRSVMSDEQRKSEPPWITLNKMLVEEGILKEGQNPSDVLINKIKGKVKEKTPVVEPSTTVATSVSPKTEQELLQERSKYERGTPEFDKAQKNLMEFYKKGSSVEETKPILKLSPEDVKATEELNKKIEENKIDKNNPEQVAKIAESPAGHPPEIPNPAIPANPNRERFIYSAVDAVRRKGPLGLRAGDAMAKFYNDVGELRGRLVNRFGNNIRELANLGGIWNKVRNPLQYIHQNTPELDHVREWFWAHHDGTALPTLTAREEAIKNEIVRSNRDVRDIHIASGIPTSGTHDPNYLAMSIDPHIISILKSGPDNPEGIRLRQDFLRYHTARSSAAHAAELLHEIDNPNRQIVSNPTARFGPIDLAAGEGIPRSWRNHNIIDTQNRYLSRAARRFAYEQAIVPERALIDQHLDDPNAKAVMNDIEGRREGMDDPIVSQLAGVVRASMMGTMTGVRDFASNLTLGWQHHSNPIQAVGNIVKAWGSMRQNIADAYETGRIRTHMNSLEFGNGFDDVVGSLKRMRDIVSDVTARNWFDQMARASSIGQGRFTTLDFLSDLNRGRLNRTGEKWFNDFAKGMDWRSGSLTPEQIRTIAARYVDSTQGTYDYRMLPRQAVEGSFSPVLSLARWNIEKSNNFIKYAIHPLMDGNPKPLLMSTLGIIGGGALVKELTSAITQRKDKDASLSELKASKEQGNSVAMPLFYKAAGLASAAGHIGILGDLTRTLLDVTYGKNRPQVYNNVLLEAAENAGTLAASYAQSVAKDGFDPDVLMHTIGKFLENSMQSYRLIHGYLSADTQADIDKANKIRDLRVFNTLSGNKITDLTSPFKVSLDDVKLKQFKNETDPEKALAEIEPLLERAYKRSGDDIGKFKKELDSLKINSYQTVPNPENPANAKQFVDYYEFLIKTQGEEEANNRLMDYAQRQMINKAKSKAIP